MQIRYKNKKNRKANNLHNGDLKQCYTIIKHHPWLLMIGLVIGLIGGWAAYHVLSVSGWQTDAMIYLEIKTDPLEEYEISNEEALITAESVLSDRSFLEQLSKQYDTLPSVIRLQQMIQYEIDSTSPVLTVLVTAPTAEESEKTANILLTASCEKIAQTLPELQPSILETADSKSAVQIKADHQPFLLKGGLIGLLIAMIMIYGYAAIRDTFESVEETKAVLNLPMVWEIRMKNPESLNHFAGAYILARPSIEKLFIVSILSQSAAELMAAICDYFAQYKQQNSDPFSTGKQGVQSEFFETKSKTSDQSRAADDSNEIDAVHENNYRSQSLADKNEKNKDAKHETFRIAWGDYRDSYTAETARQYDDVLLLISQKHTKRKKAWQVIADLQSKGVNVSGAILLNETKEKKLHHC